MKITLHPCDHAVLRALEDSSDGLTSAQLSVITGYSPKTVRQCVYKLRRSGHRIGADRVFRVRQK